MEEKTKKLRIWELDAFRGICIIGMVIVHAIWDLDKVFMPSFKPPKIYNIAITYGALLFILLSGVCVTLGKKSLKRGLIVLGCGVLVSIGFEVAELLGLGRFYPVYFGILHLLGVCMIIYPLFRRLPWWALAAIGAAVIALGFWVKDVTVDFAPLLVFGFETGIHGMSDYFPLFPNLGWFLLGAATGKLVYKDKNSLMPRFPCENPICKFFTFCGRHSLFIYILHQPVVYGIMWLIFK